MKAKRKLLISMLAIVFVLLAVVATVAIAFALQQQTITTTLNIGYTVQDIDGSVSATYTIKGEEPVALTAKKNGVEQGNTLVFKAESQELNAGSLDFPAEALQLTSQKDYVTIQYTYTNNGDRHFVASMDFDAELVPVNMKVEYSIDGESYSSDRYAVVVPSYKTNNYWIRISIRNKAKAASFSGDFNWILNGVDEYTDWYELLPAMEFQGSDGEYSVALNAGSGASEIVFPSDVNGDPITAIAASNLTDDEKTDVTTVSVPETATTIKDGAFENFTNLEDFTYNTTGVASVASENTEDFMVIGERAFKNCVKLKDIVYPTDINTIGAYAFQNCDTLTSLNFNADYTYSEIMGLVLDEGCFMDCDSLQTVIFPYYIWNQLSAGLGKSAFEGCDNLTTVTNVGVFGEISERTFYNCPKIETLSIESGDESSGGISSLTVATNAFGNCTGLKTLSIHSVDTYGDKYGDINIASGAFSGCTSLTDITFTTDASASGISWALDSFTGAPIETLTFDNTGVINKAFAGLTTLKTVNLINSLYCDICEDYCTAYVAEEAFKDCVNLETINRNNFMGSVPDSAIEGCTSLN